MNRHPNKPTGWLPLAPIDLHAPTAWANYQRAPHTKTLPIPHDFDSRVVGIHDTNPLQLHELWWSEFLYTNGRRAHGYPPFGEPEPNPSHPGCWNPPHGAANMLGVVTLVTTCDGVWLSKRPNANTPRGWEWEATGAGAVDMPEDNDNPQTRTLGSVVVATARKEIHEEAGIVLDPTTHFEFLGAGLHAADGYSPNLFYRVDDGVTNREPVVDPYSLGVEFISHDRIPWGEPMTVWLEQALWLCYGDTAAHATNNDAP